MQVVTGIFGVFGAAAVIVATSLADIDAWVRAIIVSVVVLLGVYSLARIGAK